MKTLRLDVADLIATVTIDIPPVNAQPPEFLSELAATFDEISDRADIRVAILTGAGKYFSAGADLKSRPGPDAPPGTAWHRARLMREAMFSILECKKPVICALNGGAMGAGFGIASVCDILVASETAFVNMPEIDVGLMGGVRHTMRWFPPSVRNRIILTGFRVSAAELYRYGVVEAALPPEELMPYCMDIARNIAAKSPLAIAYAKEAISMVEGMTLRDAYRWEQNNTNRLSKTEDSVEARTAVLEKRPPVFKGR